MGRARIIKGSQFIETEDGRVAPDRLDPCGNLASHKIVVCPVLPVGRLGRFLDLILCFIDTGADLIAGSVQHLVQRGIVDGRLFRKLRDFISAGRDHGVPFRFHITETMDAVQRPYLPLRSCFSGGDCAFLCRCRRGFCRLLFTVRSGRIRGGRFLPAFRFRRIGGRRFFPGRVSRSRAAGAKAHAQNGRGRCC